MSLVAQYSMNGNSNNSVDWKSNIANFTTVTTDLEITSSANAKWQSISNLDWNTATSVTVRMKKINSPTCVLRCRLLNNPAVPWTYFAQSTNTISYTSLTTSYADYTFTFSWESITATPFYVYIFAESWTLDAINKVQFAATANTWYSWWTAYDWFWTSPTSLWTDLYFSFEYTIPSLNWTDTNITYVDGKENKAASFNWTGTSNILLPTWFYDKIKTRNDYWIDFWVYPKASNWIIFSYTYWADFYFHITSANKISIRRWVNYTIESWTSWELNKWQKFTINYTSDTNAALYKNWQFIQNFTISATPNVTSQWKIGWYYDTTFPFNGIIDRWQIWTWNLSVAEIKNDYLLTTWFYG